MEQKRALEALDIADRIIRNGCATYRGAELKRTRFGTIAIKIDGSFKDERGSVIGAMDEVDLRT